MRSSTSAVCEPEAAQASLLLQHHARDGDCALQLKRASRMWQYCLSSTLDQHLPCLQAAMPTSRSPWSQICAAWCL